MNVLQSDDYIEHISSFLNVHDSYVFKTMYYRAMIARYGDTGNFKEAEFYHDKLFEVSENYVEYIYYYEPGYNSESDVESDDEDIYKLKL